MNTRKQGILLLHTVGQSFAFLQATLGLEINGKRMRDHFKHPGELAMFEQYVGPIVFGLLSLIGICALAFNEIHSKTVWAAILYYHSTASYALLSDGLASRRHPLIGDHDLAGALIFHSVMAIFCVYGFASSFFGEKKKKI